MAASELALIRETLVQVSGQLKEDKKLRIATNEKLSEVEDKLTDVEEKLPGFVERKQFGNVVAAVVGGVCVAIILVLAFVAWARNADKTEAEREQRRDQITSAARAYANCQAVNRAFNGVDVGYTYLAQLSISNVPADDPDRAGRLERINNAHQALRQGLQRTDCAGHLVELTPAQAQKVMDDSSSKLPLLPLPAPPTR